MRLLLLLLFHIIVGQETASPEVEKEREEEIKRKIGLRMDG